MSSVETGQMSAVETGQMTAAETSVLSQQKTSVLSQNLPPSAPGCWLLLADPDHETQDFDDFMVEKLMVLSKSIRAFNFTRSF